jgi:hypothetical protein
MLSVDVYLKISSLLKTKKFDCKRSCWTLASLVYPNLKKYRPEYLISLGPKVPKKVPKIKKIIVSSGMIVFRSSALLLRFQS